MDDFCDLDLCDFYLCESTSVYWENRKLNVLLLELVLLIFVLKECYYRIILRSDNSFVFKNNETHFIHVI